MPGKRFLSLTFGMFALVVLAGCQTRRAPETNSGTPAPSGGATPSTAVEKPALSAEILNMSLYPVPNNRQDLAVSIVVSVRNNGAPTNAQGWALSVNGGGRSDLGSLKPVHVNGVVEMPGAAGTRVDLDKEDLALKGQKTLLLKGAMIRGILTFVLPKADSKDFSNNNSSLVLHFEDSQGGTYRTPKAMIGAKR